MSGTVRIGHSRLARVALAVLLGLVGWLALAQATAWGQPAQKAVAGQLPTPVQQGQAQLQGSRPASAPLSLNVDLSVRESAQLNNVIAAASTPSSPSYGHYLTEGEYMARYAPTGEQVAAVESWLRSQGLQVTGATEDNLLVHVEGSTAAVESAFGVAVNNYATSGREFYANDRAPSVPADLAVAAVSGLTDYYKPVANNTCFSSVCGYTGNDFRSAYDVVGNAEGQTIAYTLWGKPLPAKVYAEYASETKTPELKIGAGAEHIEFKELGGASTVNQDGEIAIDTESAHVVAPGAHHIYFLAKEPTTPLLETALNEAAHSGAKVISNSWEAEGGCPLPEFSGEEAILQAGAALGETFFFSSGDHGAAHGCTYPSSSQYALGVGGTQLEVGAGSTWKKEAAIQDGGNCNNTVARPSWQTGIGTPHVFPEGACTGRVTPDVSAISCVAENAFFGECFFVTPEEGFIGTGGGTSLAAPVWAAAATVWNKNNAAAGRPGIGFVDPTIYALGNDSVTYARDFHDITEGSNGFAAAKGWDEASGWGSPNLNNLANNEAQLAYTGATEAVHGQSVTLSATLTDKGTSQAVPGHTVHFAVGAESCEAATNSGGVASCGVTINDAPGGYTLTAKASATAAYLESSTSSGFTVTAPTEPPIFGRCLKASGEKVGGKTVYHGEFTTATCTTKSAERTGKFEWDPGAGSNPFYSLAIKPKTTIKIETPGKHSLVCTGATGEGEVTGLQTVEIALILTGCSDEDEKCGNIGEGEVEIPLLFGKLGWQNRALKKVDLQLNGSEFVFSDYECPKKGVLLGTTGILLPVTVNKFTNKYTDKFTESKGKQVPDALEGGPTLFFEEDRINFEPRTETIEDAGLSATLTQTNEEKLEINTAF
jgi:kumamolisin